MWPLIEPPGRASIAPLSDGTASDKDEKSISACPESAIGAVPKKKRVQSCNRLRFGKHWVNREELSFSRFPCWEFCVSFRYFSPCWRRSFSLLNKPTAPKTAHTTRRQWIKKTAKRPHPSPPPTLPLPQSPGSQMRNSFHSCIVCLAPLAATLAYSIVVRRSPERAFKVSAHCAEVICAVTPVCPHHMHVMYLSIYWTHETPSREQDAQPWAWIIISF